MFNLHRTTTNFIAFVFENQIKFVAYPFLRLFAGFFLLRRARDNFQAERRWMDETDVLWNIGSSAGLQRKGTIISPWWDIWQQSVKHWFLTKLFVLILLHGGLLAVWLARAGLWVREARFSKDPETFRRSKIPNLTITELFYSHILNMNRGSLHTRSFRRIHFSVFRYRWTKNGFTGSESFRGFRETGPCLKRCAVFLGKTL